MGTHLDSHSHSHMDDNLNKDPTTSPSMSMNTNMNMASTFSSSTTITVLFTGWTTSTPTQYILALLLFFLLAIFNRFLGTLKFQLEQSWSQPSLVPPTLKLTAMHSRRNTHKAKLSPLTTYMRVNGGENEDIDIEETLPVAYNDDQSGHSTTHLLDRGALQRMWSCNWGLPSWRASGRWSLRMDGVRGLLELTRALIGYLLMLGVMSFNPGVFVTVLLGALCGEMLLGRFSRGMTGWQEGSCHGS